MPTAVRCVHERLDTPVDKADTPYPMTRTYAGVLPTAAHNEYRLVRGCQCDRRIQPPGKNHARARRTGENPVTRAPARTPTGPQIRRCRRRCRCCRRCSTHLTTRHLRPSRRCCRDSTRHRAGRAGSCHAPPPGGCCRTSSPLFCRRVPFGLEAGPTRHRGSRNPIRSRSLVPFTG